ncbi:hypothetical protein ACA910_000171 [Epithemia clementina (nom. ined.)]
MIDASFSILEKSNEDSSLVHKRCLWKPTESANQLDRSFLASTATKGNCNHHHTLQFDDDDDYDKLWNEYALHCPNPKSLLFYVARNLVVVQEIALTINFLLRYQLFLLFQQQQSAGRNVLPIHLQQQNDLASLVMVAALLLVLVTNASSSSSQRSLTNKARYRLTDGCLIGIILRFLSTLLQSLTASYADDAVYTLALCGMLVHVLVCDYAYANGKETATSLTTTRATQQSLHHHQHKKQQLQTSSSPLLEEKGLLRAKCANPRPAFEGGTLSLNAAFFATILLISRLHENIAAYVLCLISVISFAFYPLTRHELAKIHPPTTSPVLAIITFLLSISTAILCRCIDEDGSQQLLYYFIALVFVLLVVLPSWKYHIQWYKVHLRGPWDIPSAESIMLTSTR